MRNFVFLVFLILGFSIPKLKSQGCSALSVRVAPSPTSSPKRDTTVCKGTNLSLSVSVPTLRSTTSYTVNTIPYIDTLPCESTGSLVAGTGITIDDGYSSIQNIGFNFCFYGKSHSQIQICDNGFLTFSTNKPVLGTFTAPFVPNKLPLSAHPNPSSGATTLPPNSILGAWLDAYLVTSSANPGSGTITTQTVGTAPFRACIVKWNNCRYFVTTCRINPNMVLNMKIVLYETTNLIDVYIKTKPICTLSSTSFRYATTQGLQGDSTFKFILTPGRDSSIWDGAMSAVRYTPNGAVNPTTVQWTKNGSVISTNSIANINITDDTASYVASATIVQPCPTGSIVARDTMKVYGLNNFVQTYELFDTIKCQNSKVMNATNAGVIGYTWDNGSTSAARVVSSAGRYFVVRRYNVLGCQRDTVFYNVVKFAYPKIDSVRRTGCFNQLANGQLRLFVSGDTNNLKLGTVPNPLSTANPVLNQRNGSYTYWVRNAGGCADSITMTHDSMNASYFKRVNFCNQDSSGLLRLTPLGGYAPFTFNLTGRAAQSIDSFNKITTGVYTIQISDKNGCTIQRTDTIVPFTNLALSITVDSVKCFGDSTGKISAQLSGGKPSYFYSINNGIYASSGIFNLLKAGSYQIKTKDAANCPIDTTIVVQQYSQIIATNTKIKNCPFNSNGSITINASGGASGYEYRFNTGAFQSSPQFTGLTNGSFTYSIRDKNNCVRIFTDTLISYPKPLLNIQAQKNVTCFGANNGKIKVNTSQGIPPYIYAWNVGGNADSLSGLSPATYRVYVSDSNLCKDTLDIQITQPDSLYAVLNFKHPSCNLSINGEIKVLPIGGTPPFQYSINGSVFSSVDSFAGLAPASYVVQVRDSQLCLKTYSGTMIAPSPLVLSMVVDSVKCMGGSDGQIRLMVSGGVPSYTYRLNTAVYDTFRVKSNLIAGSYSVSIRDTNGCTKDSSIVVPTYSSINLSISVLDTIRCKNGNDGRISISASGGRSPYTYSINGVAFQASNIFPNLNQGMKYIRVKDANNCEVIDSLVMIEPPGMASTLTVLKNVSCYGLSDAKARVNVIGGTPPYTYLWSNGVVIDSTSILNKGFHYVKMTDNRNCKDSIGFTISQPDSLNASFNLYHPKCHGLKGSIKINPTGGTSPYQYAIGGVGFGALDSFVNIVDTVTITLLDQNACSKVFRPILISPPKLTASFKVDSVKCFGGNSGQIIINHSGGTGSKLIRINSLTNAGDTVKNLVEGNQFVEVMDVNNCKVDSLLYVPQYADISTNILNDTVKCYGTATGKIRMNVSGGAGGYSYAINSGAYSPANVLTNLSAGTYTAKVRDAYLCEKTQSVTIPQIDSMVIQPIWTHNLCHKDSLGKVRFVVSGGTPPYLISWNGSSFSTSDSFTKLPAGNYSYTVKDKNNCTKTGSISILQPLPIRSAAIIDSVKCFKQATGQIEVIPTGGTPGYSISFAGQSFAPAMIFSNLAAGVYNIKIQDNNGCIKDTNVEVHSSDTFYYSFIVDSVDCFNANNGRVTITPYGGKSPYQFKLNSGLFTSNNVIANLNASTHTIQVRDHYNCILNLSVSLNNPLPITIQVDSNIGNLCFGENKGRIQISSSGGRLPHTYRWSNGEVTNRIQNLTAGTYTLTVRDAKNCMWIQNTLVSEPTNFSILVNQKNLKCFGDKDGSIALTVSGATPIAPSSYDYNWSNGGLSNSISGLASGLYAVTITDKNLCATKRTFNLTQPDSITFDLKKTNSHCAISKDGILEVVNLSGGTFPFYKYDWSHGSAAMNATNLAPFNTYSLTVTDTNNCQKKKSDYIDTMYVLRIKLDTLGIPRCPYSALNLAMRSLSGVAPFEYQLGTMKSKTGDYLNQLNIPYHIVVTDAVGCLYADSIDLVPRDTMVSSLVEYPQPCESANFFPVKANVRGGKSPYIFEWPRAYWSERDSARYNQTGYYEVLVRDGYGCFVKNSLNLRLPEGALHGVVTDKKDLRCYQLNDGRLRVEGRGGYPPYRYLWNTKDTGNTLSGLSANFYKVVITDDENCQYTLNETLKEPDSLYFDVRHSDVNCKEDVNGTITVTPYGGSPGYMYTLDTNPYQKAPNFIALGYGNYRVAVRDDSACIASKTVYIDYTYKLTLTIDSVFQISAGESIFLNPKVALTPSSASYFPKWSPGEGLSCTDCLSPEFHGYHTTLLRLSLEYGQGCITDIHTLVRVSGTEQDELYVPTAFSPNAENPENREFKAYANRVLRFEMAVYNRWGEKVFATDDIRKGWNGTYKGENAPSGLYTYTLRLTKIDGQRIVKSGEVNLF